MRFEFGRGSEKRLWVERERERERGGRERKTGLLNLRERGVMGREHKGL